MKISSIFAILTASAILAACDFLDEYNPNSVTVGNYYTSEEDIVASLNGVYTSLTQGYVANNHHYFTDVRANTTVVTAFPTSSTIIRLPRRMSMFTTVIRSCTRSSRGPIRSSPIWVMSVMLLLRPAIRMRPKRGSCGRWLITGW